MREADMNLNRVLMWIIAGLIAVFSGSSTISADVPTDDYIVIYHSDLNGSALTSLIAIIESRGHSVGSYSISDGVTADSIRNIIQSMYFGSALLPKYVLLVGAARQLDTNEEVVSAANSNFIPGFFSTDYFGHYTLYDIEYINFDSSYFYDSRHRRNAPSLFLGRLPAVGTEDIQNYADKLSAYYANISPAPWKDDILLVVGDRDRGPGTPMPGQLNTHMDNISSLLPASIEQGRLNYSDFPDDLSRQADLIDSINAGKFILFTMSTGASATNFSYFLYLGEGDNFDAHTDLDSTDKFHILFGASCNLGESDTTYDDGSVRLIAENFLFAPHRGPIAIVGPGGYTGQLANFSHASYLFDILFDHPNWTVGQIAWSAVIRAYDPDSDGNLMDTHEMYTVFGDPSLELYIDSLPEPTTLFDFEITSEIPFQNVAYDKASDISMDTVRVSRTAEPNQRMYGGYSIKLAGHDNFAGAGSSISRWDLFEVNIPLDSSTKFLHFYAKVVSHPNDTAKVSVNCLLESGGMLSDATPQGPPRDQYGVGLEAQARVDTLNSGLPNFYAFDISGHAGETVSRILLEYAATSSTDTGWFEAYIDNITFSDTWGQSPTVGEINMPSSVAKGGTATASLPAKDFGDRIMNGDTLAFEWTASDGYFTGEGAQVTYHAPGYTISGVLITCSVSDLGGHLEERTKNINVTDPSSGCPYLYVLSRGRYQLDNVILTESENPFRENKVVVDYLPLSIMPDASGGTVRLKLAELNSQISYIDEIELIAVPYHLNDQEELGIRTNGDVVVLSNPIAPTYASSSLGHDLSASIKENDGDIFRYYGSGSIVLHYRSLDSLFATGSGNLKTVSVTTASGGTAIPPPPKDEEDPILKLVSNSKNAVFTEQERGNFVTVELLHSGGGATAKDVIYPRIRTTIPVLTDLSDEIFIGSRASIRLSWEQFYSADQVAFYKYRTLQALPPFKIATAKGSDTQFLLDKLTSVDGNYALLGAGEEIYLTFDVPSVLIGETVQYVIKTTGYYVTPPENSSSANPNSLEVQQNYPNPFNPQTNLSFSLSKDAEVRIEVYNVLGQLVRIVANERYLAGVHSVQWDSRDENGGTVASGVYFARFVSGEYMVKKKMVLLK